MIKSQYERLNTILYDILSVIKAGQSEIMYEESIDHDIVENLAYNGFEIIKFSDTYGKILTKIKLK